VLLIYGKRGKEQKEEVEICQCFKFMGKGLRSRKRGWKFDSATNLWEKWQGAERGGGTLRVLLI
jgi:hypothetical protein